MWRPRFRPPLELRAPPASAAALGGSGWRLPSSVLMAHLGLAGTTGFLSSCRSADCSFCVGGDKSEQILLLFSWSLLGTWRGGGVSGRGGESGWLLTHCVTEDDSKFLILLPPPSESDGITGMDYQPPNLSFVQCWGSNPELHSC